MRITQATLKAIIKEEVEKIFEDGVDEGAFSPNHYCVHHGGVMHEDEIKLAEAVSHNYDRDLGRVTHYNMKLANGTILENVAAEDIQVTEASLASEHMHSAGARDDDEEVDEAHCGARDDDLEEAAEDVGAARLDARQRVRAMAEELFGTVDALDKAGLSSQAKQTKAVYDALRALHASLGDGRDLGDV